MLRRTTLLVLLAFPLCLFSQIKSEDLYAPVGDYAVGYSYTIRTDSMRTYNRYLDYNTRQIPRPIPVSMWYPVSAFPSTGSGRRAKSSLQDSRPKEEHSGIAETENEENYLKVKDYFKVLAAEEEWENLPEYFYLDWFWYIPKNEKNKKYLELKSKAVSNAPQAQGKFPVLLYAPSYQASSVENFAICEYLASHGYVVIASPSRGAKDRRFTGGKLIDLETQTRDILFLTQYAQSLNNVDADKIGTFGFSFGGMSNVLAQMQNDEIKAVASLDGSIKYQLETIEQSAFYEVSRATVPFLHLTQKDIPNKVLKADNINPKLNTDFKYYDTLKVADKYRVKMLDMAHGNFGAFSVLFEDRDPRQEKSDEQITYSHRLSQAYIKAFFDTYLKKSQRTEALVNTLSSNPVAQLDYQLGTPAVATPLDFITEAAYQDYKNLQGLFAKYKSQNPNFEIPQGILNHKGLRLGFDPATKTQAYRVFKFAMSLYPSSANLEDSWAEMYLLHGDKENAVLHFKKSLALDAGNENAIKRLRELE